MDIERVKIIAELLQRAIKVEELRSPAAFAAFGSGLSPDERKTVLDGRAAKIESVVPSHTDAGSAEVSAGAGGIAGDLRRAAPVCIASAAAFLAAYLGVRPHSAVVFVAGDVLFSRDRGDVQLLGVFEQMS